MRFVDRVGQRFGKLTVIERAPGGAPGGNVLWICDCDCGTRGHVVSSGNIKKAKSCGCVRRYRQLREALTQARLKELLHYNPETGEFFWLVNKSRNVKTGDRAGSKSGKGYWALSIDGKTYPGHHLAWLYTHGQLPNRQLDHKNRIKSDGRIANLRETTRSQNAANSRARRTSRSGIKGAYQLNGRWRAAITYNGKCTHLGTFDTPEAAHKAYCYVAKILHGEFFCDGKDRETP